MPLGSSTRRGYCGLNWCSGGMGTFCHEVAGAAEGVAVACGTFAGMGFFVWATELIARKFIIKTAVMKSKTFPLVISALLWRVQIAWVSVLPFPWCRWSGFLRERFCWRR